MDDTPIGLQLQKVHKLLSRELEPFTSAEILERTGVDIDANHQIYLSLTDDKSKVLRDKDGKWRWASKYQVTNYNSLIAFIGRTVDGVYEKDLWDSYKGVKEDIKKLKQKKAVEQLKSGSTILLFPRHHRYIDTSLEMRSIYSAVTLPDEIEVHRYLVAEGVKQADDALGIKISHPFSAKR